MKSELLGLLIFVLQVTAILATQQDPRRNERLDRKLKHEVERPAASNCEPTTTTTQEPEIDPLAPRDIKCLSVVGYYSGIFMNLDSQSDSVNVDFQIRLSTNDVDKKVYFTADYWNDQKINRKDVHLKIENSITKATHVSAYFCWPVNSTNCTIPYVTEQDDDFHVQLHHTPIDRPFHNQFDFIYFPEFDNRFTLTNAVGQCTNQQVSYEGRFKPQPNLFNYCLCCNDYLPLKELGCPINGVNQNKYS